MKLDDEEIKKELRKSLFISVLGVAVLVAMIVVPVMISLYHL